MYMLIIWYCLISAIYLLLNIMEYLFTKLFKFDKSFFSLFYSKASWLLNLQNTWNKNYNNDNLNSLNFKNLYNEYKFFYEKNKITNLKNNLILFCANKHILNGQYNNDLSLLVYLSKSELSNTKKINLDKIYNTLGIGRINFLYTSNKLYTNYKFLSNKLSNYSVNVSNILESSIQNNWSIKYAPSNFLKYINLNNLSQYNILFLRKSKVFNKGRYSRNRQYYRTGVYWCLYVNIIAVIGIYFWFYRFTMNFGYLWWLLFVFIASFIVPKTIKYRLYNPVNLINSISNDIIWISTILVNLYNGLFFFLKNFLLLSELNTKFNKVLSKLFSYFNNANNGIHMWEYNNANYYVLGSVNSQPYWFQKIKIKLLAFMNFLTKIK